jgi:hypothetical protein
MTIQSGKYIENLTDTVGGSITISYQTWNHVNMQRERASS